MQIRFGTEGGNISEKLRDLWTNLVEDAFRRYSRLPTARKSFSFLHPFSGTKGETDVSRLLQLVIIFETAKVRNEAYPPQIKYLAKRKSFQKPKNGEVRRSGYGIRFLGGQAARPEIISAAFTCVLYTMYSIAEFSHDFSCYS